MAGGAGSAFLTHLKVSTAIFVWVMGVAATLVCLFYCIKGTYQKYMDLGWDTYY